MSARPASSQVAERRRQACELRLAGVGYAQIARQLGYASASGAHAAVQQGMKAAFEEPHGEVRRLELERLDALLVGLWPKARRGDASAVDRVLRVMDRRARYLGLDAAEEQPATTDPLDEVAEKRARRLGT